MDFVYKIDNVCINIELNTNPHDSYKRNVRYLSSLHAREVNEGEAYKDYKTIQININKETFGRTKEIKRKIYLRDTQIYDRSMKIYVINLPILKKLWYTSSERITKDMEVLICFFMENVEEYEKLRKNERIDKIMTKMEKFSKNEKEWISYRDENEIELTHNYGLKVAREKGERCGIRKGRKEGISKRNSEIATNMLNMNLDIGVIKKATGLSEQAILDLK